jgi:SAM-dependent methyltransferase
MSKPATGEQPSQPLAPSYPKDLFQGTAYYYARYRVPYPQQLVEDLRVRAKLTGEGRLLDLACGSGRVALAFSPYFREVWAVDWESEMIEVGREEANQRGIANLYWMVSRAEDVEAPAESFELITIGEAFHRLDQPLIMTRSLEWLRPGCYLATMGCYGITKGTEPWQIILREVVRKWTSHGSDIHSQSKNQLIQPRGADHEQEVLKASGFQEVESYPFLYPYVWTLDSIIGNLYSTSGCSKRILGDKAEQFEADIKRALLSYDSQGLYPETVRFGYTLARKP